MYKIYFDSMSYPYVVQADNEDDAIIAAANLYYKEFKRNYTIIDKIDKI
jgi:hypothetical protein